MRLKTAINQKSDQICCLTLTQQKHSPHGSGPPISLLLKQREPISITSAAVVPHTCTVNVLQDNLTALSSNLHAQTKALSQMLK